MIILRQKEFGKIRQKILRKLDKKYDINNVHDNDLTNRIITNNAEKCGVNHIYEVTGNPSSYYRLGSRDIYLGDNDHDSASTLAHELGHAYHYNNPDSKFGKAVHKFDSSINNIYGNSHKTKKIIGSVASGGSGLAAGYLAQREKEKGDDKGAVLLSIGSLLVPTLGHAPELGREITASSRGLKMMRESGASRRQIKSAKKSLGSALGTYGIDLGKSLLINAGGQVVGRGVYKLTHKKKYKKEEKENEEKDNDNTKK